MRGCPRHAHQAIAKQQPAQAHRQFAQRVGQNRVERGEAFYFEHDARLQMVAQVFADAGQVMLHANAVRTQARAVPNARQLQQLRRLNRARAQRHLARRQRAAWDTRRLRALRHATLSPLDAAHALAIEQQPRHLRVRYQSKIRTPLRRADITFTHTPAQATAGRHLNQATTVIIAAIGVGVLGEARLGTGTQERIAGCIARCGRGNHQRPVMPTHCRVTLGVTLHALEQRQQLGVTPAGVAQRRPVVILSRVAAHPEHAIDVGGAADVLATRTKRRTAIDARRWLSLKAPHRPLTDDDLGDASWHAHPQPRIIYARFEQQHAIA